MLFCDKWQVWFVLRLRAEVGRKSSFLLNEVPVRRRALTSNECAICIADGTEPNQETLQAFNQIESGEVYEYTGVVGSGMLRNILDGDNMRGEEVDISVREPVLQEEEHL